MSQNAKSLATICILSTMLIVTISGTLSLYIGQEKILKETYPYDVSIAIDPDVGEQAIRDFDKALIELAGKYNVTVSADRGKLVYGKPPYDEIERNNYVRQEYKIMDGLNLLYFNEYMRFDVNGSEADSLAFMEGVKSLCSSMFPEGSAVIARNIFKAREEYYGMYGGLLFLGVFFGLLFLAVTVLIIYFKQVSEGYEDKNSFHDFKSRYGMTSRLSQL